MGTESPFFMTKLECPICKTVNEFETIRVGAYTESERDTDFCPSGRKWRNPRYQAYNPLLDFTATCANCFYSREFSNDFKEWKDDAYFKTYRLKLVKERHLELLARSGSVIKAIGQELDANRHPNETAILKLILTIIDETLNEKQVDLDLGRFYLRLAWIFREMENGESTDDQAIRGHLVEIDHKIDALGSAMSAFRERLKALHQTVAGQFDDEKIPAEIKSLLFPIKDKYDQEIASLSDLAGLMDGKLHSLETLSQEHKKSALGGTSNDSVAGFHSHRSFYDFLMQIKEQWNGVPVNEMEALRSSVKYYKIAFEEGRDIAEGNQQIQASYLIAELSRRIGDFETAREYFNTTIRSGQEFIYKNKGDQSRTALGRKILELAIEQGRHNLAEAKAI